MNEESNVSAIETMVHVSHLSGIKKGKEILAVLVNNPEVTAPYRARFMEKDKIKKQPSLSMRCSLASLHLCHFKQDRSLPSSYDVFSRFAF
jgi:hypothetical protein